MQGLHSLTPGVIYFTLHTSAGTQRQLIGYAFRTLCRHTETQMSQAPHTSAGTLRHRCLMLSTPLQAHRDSARRPAEVRASAGSCWRLLSSPCSDRMASRSRGLQALTVTFGTSYAAHTGLPVSVQGYEAFAFTEAPSYAASLADCIVQSSIVHVSTSAAHC